MKNWEQALARALDRRWRRYRQALKRCQRNFSEVSTHASRIEARRLAAQLELLGMFAPPRELAKARRILKRHLDTFNPLRDAQVQLSILDRECGHLRGVKTIRKMTARRERRCRREAERRIRQVKPRRLKGIVELLIERLREGGKDSAKMCLDRSNIVRRVDAAFARVIKCRQQMDAADVATIHRTRVAFKKFRYMMESMRLLFPVITPRRLAAMQAFQGVLGDLQDTDVFLERVDKLIRKERLAATEVETFRRWLWRRRARQIKRCLRRADAIFKFWPLKSARQVNCKHESLTDRRS